jgi:hypothetical protein
MNDDKQLRKLSGLVQKDRIQILLAEYSAMRAEILARTGYGFQIASVALVGMTWFLQQTLTGKPWWFWLLMVLVACGFLLAIHTNTRDLKRAAKHVRRLEHEINSRAFEQLLVWETAHGMLSQMPLWRSFFSAGRDLPREKLPPLSPKYIEQDLEGAPGSTP